MKYLLDTNVFKELYRPDPHKNVAAWQETVEDADLSISAITVREIAKGIARLRKTKPEVAETIARVNEAVFDSYEGRILPIDRAVAESWGVALAARDKHIDDAGLAATAKVHGLVLVTRNTRDLAGRGVRLLDPFKSPPQRST